MRPFRFLGVASVHSFVHSTDTYGAPTVRQTLGWAQQRLHIWVKHSLLPKISRERM